MTGYVFEHDGQQYAPDGKLSETVDAAAHNAALDKLTTDAMAEGLPVVLYLTEHKDTGRTIATTWTGKHIATIWRVKCSWHNMAGKNGRADVWFTAFGHNWHGVNIGDNQILRCKTVRNRR